MRQAATGRPDGKGLARHFEGWQLGVVIVAMAAIAVAVMVPRSVLPEEVPLPRLAPREVAEARARAVASGRALDGAAPSENVRILAARLRAYSLAEHAGDRLEMQHAAERVLELSGPLLVAEPQAMLDLRAHLTERFVRAFYVFARTGAEVEDLAVVGGDAAQTFTKKGWVDDSNDPTFDLVLRSFYKRRFGGLVSPGAPLPIDDVEERARVRFLIRHPPRLDFPDPQGLFSGHYVLSQLDDAAALDPAYPLRYAQGIALFHVGKYEASAAAFDAYLLERPDGPYHLRAVNYLKTAVEHAGGGD
ncbi:MAG: hypothetical protein JNL21_25550 [Myxococcales bacterium]|nr:hypothetical protein [Myxococcales bacterium]